MRTMAERGDLNSRYGCPDADFECGAFNHSATSPGCKRLGPLVEASWILFGTIFCSFDLPAA